MSGRHHEDEDMGRCIVCSPCRYEEPHWWMHTFGRGALICKSTKQKLNTKSSTEAELVGASDVLPINIWLDMFLGAQGYFLEENVFAQDNQSTVKLEMNGRRSCGQQSRHIDIRFFLSKTGSTAAI